MPLRLADGVLSVRRVGFLVAIAWYVYYRDFPQEHPGVNKAELNCCSS